MWTPKQLLLDEVVHALRLGGFSQTQIEYLGWMNGTASALNRSLNPVRAAHTILAGEGAKKMVPKFLDKKKQSVIVVDRPDHEETDTLFGRFDRWANQQEAEATPYRASDQARLDAAAEDD